MLRKEDFPKEPIEILKDVLPSEEFKKLASLNQERLRCMAEADGLMGEVIEIESKLLVQLNKIRSIEAEILANTAISPLFRIDCIQFQLAGSHHCDQKLFSSFIMAVRALPRVNIRIFFRI